MVTKPSKLAITISIFRKWIRHFDHCFHFVSRFLFVFGCFANVSVLISHIVVHFVFKYLFRLRLHLIGKIDGVHYTLYKWVRSCCFFLFHSDDTVFVYILIPWWCLQNCVCGNIRKKKSKSCQELSKNWFLWRIRYLSEISLFENALWNEIQFEISNIDSTYQPYILL